MSADLEGWHFDRAEKRIGDTLIVVERAPHGFSWYITRPLADNVRGVKTLPQDAMRAAMRAHRSLK